MEAKEKISKLLDQRKEMLADCCDKIWEYAEIRFDTRQSSDILCKILEDEGFKLKRGLAHMENAFTATYGSGKPVIGILAEFDALGNMSQAANTTQKQPLSEEKAGHGCGHNVLGTGSIAGAIGIKSYMEETGLSGTIKVFGCPAEESGYGKAFMAREGIFNNTDACLTWHPGDCTMVWDSNTLAVAQLYFHFEGIPAHAAAMPELGRSALDAAELMNVGVNFLREHIVDSARIHYAFTDAGGTSANVVQPTASLYYFVRAQKNDQVLELCKRVEKIAEGAAMMTGTKLHVEWDSACSGYIPNNTLNNILYKNMLLFTPIQLDEKNLTYEKALCDTRSEQMKGAHRSRLSRMFPELSPKEIEAIFNEPIITRPFPFMESTGIPSPGMGSTDVGDVSWIAPTGQILLACEPQGVPPHSWQWVANGTSEAVHQGLLAAGKILAASAYDLLTNPNYLRLAKEEHTKDLDGKHYRSIIPEHVHPKQ